MKKIIIASVAALILTACGGESGGSDSNKDLFSLWKTDQGGAMDLSSGALGVEMGYSIFMEDGAECNCDLRLLGDQSSGNYILNSCSHTYGTGSGEETPNCNALDNTGTYSKTTSTLTICNSESNCTDYN